MFLVYDSISECKQDSTYSKYQYVGLRPKNLCSFKRVSSESSLASEYD